MYWIVLLMLGNPGRKNGEVAAFSSATRVVQDAPGAGKTSIGNHLRAQWGKEKKHTPLVARLSIDTPTNPLAVFKIICEIVNPKALEKLKTTQSIQHTAAGGFDQIIKAEYERHSVRQELHEPATEWIDLCHALVTKNGTGRLSTD